MKDLEKQIEEAAYNCSEDFRDSYKRQTVRIDSFITGAKSQAAKEYNQQGMYSGKEVRQLFIDGAEEFFSQNKVFGDFLLKQDLEWFEQNKKK